MKFIGRHRRRTYWALLARVGRRPTIGEIAHAHGFVSESHFSRSFRDHYGQAPGSIEPTDLLTSPESDPDGMRYDLVLDWMNGGSRKQ